MESVLKQEDAVYYVSVSSIEEFIEKNSDIEDVYKFLQKEELVFETGRSYWIRNNMTSNGELDKWIEAFFDAHPWIDKMMVVFDD